ncbi:MAG: hypothetical protein AAF514_00125 [Verrucomicrobiota bacterium]
MSSRRPVARPVKGDSAATSRGTFDLPFDRAPLDRRNPYWKAMINRDRIYDFYAKQALHYGPMERLNPGEVLPAFPGIDGGIDGHWGNQHDDTTWKDGRVLEMDHGSMVSGVFRGAGKTIPRGVSVSLGDGLNAVFDLDRLHFEAAWKGELARWSEVRRGFIHGIPMGAKKVSDFTRASPAGPEARLLGIQRSGRKVFFVYEENGEKIHRWMAISDGKLVENLGGEPPASDSPLQWPDRLATKGVMGEGAPYAIDTLTLPYDNPWKALLFISGFDFLAEDRLALSTLHGDVWICEISGPGLGRLEWKRFATGLHQPLGLKVADGVIHVMCRDQLVRLEDRNEDGEADFHACVSMAHQTSAGGHDFITGLERDDSGRWYVASGNQGLCRFSADGSVADVLATGLRNPNGLGISPDGRVILTSVQEGNWTPASAICDVVPGGHYGSGGPLAGDLGYVPPMVYLPRGMDNSSGGQTYIDSKRWGPVHGNWIHLSTGFATHFLVLREVIESHSQGAAIPLPGEFLSGAQRARFSPMDGQLYVAGAQGWGNYGTRDGSLQRVRFVGGAYPYPVAYETRENGIILTFAREVPDLLDSDKWFAQQWNYLFSAAYGSPEYSVRNADREGHDLLEIRSVHGLAGNRVFVEIPQLRPVDQLHLHFDGPERLEMFATLHRLGEPFTAFPGYRPIEKEAWESGATASVETAALITACTACHHPNRKVVGPPWSEIRQRYAGNPDGIVRWAMNPENKNPDLPPMPSFKFLGEKTLEAIANQILSAN